VWSVRGVSGLMGLKNWTIRLDDLRSYDEGVIPGTVKDFVSGKSKLRK